MQIAGNGQNLKSMGVVLENTKKPYPEGKINY
jgi:hypothetical protein